MVVPDVWTVTASAEIETALETARTSGSDALLRDLVWAMAVPVLIADYAPVLTRFEGVPLEEIKARLHDNGELLRCIESIGVRAQSRSWARLYGSGDVDVPGLAERLNDPVQFPHLKVNLIETDVGALV